MVEPETILLIDDDAVLSDLYRVKFERAGFRVIVRHNAATTLEELRGGLQPALIVLDLAMPGMDGFSFLQEVQRTGLHLPPVIVLTNQNTDIDKEKAFALGANNYIVKASATPKEILERIVEILRTQDAISRS